MASTVEVEWDEEQRDLMVALSWYRDQICPLCGWLVEVCGDPQNANLIEATLPSRCYVTTNIDVAQEAETANNVVVQQPRGRLWGARLKSPI